MRLQSDSRHWDTLYDDGKLAITPAERVAIEEMRRRSSWHTPVWWRRSRAAIDRRPTARQPVRLDWPNGVCMLSAPGCFGLVSLPTRFVEVLPKIERHAIGGPNGETHFGTLLARYLHLPAISPESIVEASRGQLTEIVMEAFVTSADLLIADGLAQGYTLRQEELQIPRGAIQPFGTALLYYAGRLHFDCVFEDFTVDMPLNRVIRRALEIVLDAQVRMGRGASMLAKRTRPLLECLNGVGPVRESDLATEPDWSNLRYEAAVSLAIDVIESTGRLVSRGEQTAACILYDAPGVAEVALRRIVSEELSEVGLRAIAAAGASQLRGRSTTEAYSPDILILDGTARLAIADVKYKLLRESATGPTGSTDWRYLMRGDLNEVTTFATAAGVQHAALLSFRSGLAREGKRIELARATPGALTVEHFAWDLGLPPAAAEAGFRSDIRAWAVAAKNGVSGEHPDGPSACSGAVDLIVNH